MISRHPDSATPIDKASKKPLNSDRVLVSRKAMQNYNRFSSPQNISDTFFQKKTLFSEIGVFWDTGVTQKGQEKTKGGKGIKGGKGGKGVKGIKGVKGGKGIKGGRTLGPLRSLKTRGVGFRVPLYYI